MSESKDRKLKVAAFILGILLWFGLMVGHAKGGQIAAWGFQNYGRATVEPVFIGFVLVSFITGALWTLVRVRSRYLALSDDERPSYKRSLAYFCLQTALWAGAALLVERILVVLHTELFHYFQYGLIAFILYGGCRKPAIALAFSTLLGMVDEYYQFEVYYGESSNIFYDWNDCLLNLIGSAGGVLLGQLFFAPHKEEGIGRPVILLCALGTLGGSLLFEFPWKPFWKFVPLGGNILRRYHETAFGEGMVMLFTALAAFTWLLAKYRPVRLVLALFAGCLSISIVALSWHFAPTPLDPPLPITYVSRCTEAIKIDGRLDEAAWSRAFPTRMLVNRENQAVPSATEVKVLWDKDALYIAFIVPDGDILGTKRERDDPTLPAGEVVEVFLDPRGQGKEYIEIEVNPCNSVYDLLIHTQVPTPGKAFSWFKGDASWNSKNLETAVSVEGSLSVKGGPWDTDKRWIAEIKLPFSDLPEGVSRPQAGTRWRANFFRVNRPRQSPAEYSCWSPSMSMSFHQSERFGTLLFSNKIGKVRK